MLRDNIYPRNQCSSKNTKGLVLLKINLPETALLPQGLKYGKHRVNLKEASANEQLAATTGRNKNKTHIGITSEFKCNKFLS